MKWERTILLTFFGNYIINTVIAGLVVAILPASSTKGITSPQYIVFAVVSALFVAVLTWWYFRKHTHAKILVAAVLFGVTGFVVSVLSTFVSGISGVLVQTGSFAQALTIIPNFGPFLANWSTLVLFAVWLVPAVFVAYLVSPETRNSIA